MTPNPTIAPQGVAHPSTGPQAILVNLDQVQAGPVDWLWRSHVPKGEVSIVTGDPDAGKTFALLDLAKTVMEAGVLPDDTQASGGRVLWLDGENGADEIKRRLQAMGFSSWDNLRLMSEVEERDRAGAIKRLLFSLDRHQEALVQAVADFHPDWVIIDPLVAFHRRDEIKATQVRGLMHWLAELARTYNLAITAVQHPNKMMGAPTVYRVRGSLDFVAAARAVLRVEVLRGPHSVREPGGGSVVADDVRVLTVEKLNLGPKPSPVAFRIEDGRVIWLGGLEVPELLSEKERAVGFLRSFLANGPQREEAVKKAADWEDLSMAAVRRAKRELGVKSRRRAGRWWWQLRSQGEQRAGGSGLTYLAHVEHVLSQRQCAIEGAQGDQDEQHDQGEQGDHSAETYAEEWRKGEPPF